MPMSTPQHIPSIRAQVNEPPPQYTPAQQAFIEAWSPVFDAIQGDPSLKWHVIDYPAELVTGGLVRKLRGFWKESHWNIEHRNKVLYIQRKLRGNA